MACLLQSVSSSAHSIMKTLPRSLASTWGTTAAERTPSFPCDRFLVPFDAAYFRAVPIRAPASLLFRWLCQLRVAPYSYDWIDNGGHLSPRELIPGVLATQDIRSKKERSCWHYQFFFFAIYSSDR